LLAGGLNPEIIVIPLSFGLDFSQGCLFCWQGKNNQEKNNKVRCISEKEFSIFWGIMIAACIHGQKGNLWDADKPEGYRGKVNLSKYLSRKRFLSVTRKMAFVFAKPESDDDPRRLVQSGSMASMRIERRLCQQVF